MRSRTRCSNPATRIVEADREHPFEPVEATQALLVVKPHDHLGIGLGTKSMAPPLQIVAKFPIIVDFAIEDDSGPPLGPDRLMALREVDDA